jgi:uncharacterized membrane protein YgcG
VLIYETKVYYLAKFVKHFRLKSAKKSFFLEKIRYSQVLLVFLLSTFYSFEMPAIYILIGFVLFFSLESCTNIYSKCLTKCQRRTDSCYLLVMNNVQPNPINQFGGFLVCQRIESDCLKSCRSSSSSTTSSSRSSSSSSSSSSGGGSSSSGGSGGSSGSSHEINPAF